MRPFPHPPASLPCYCEREGLLPLNARCICTIEEKCLRGWASGRPSMPAMTPEQREWCYQEIEAVEGYSRDCYLDADAARLANGVLAAWLDFCLDKGLL